jgi:hypothetical protein
VARGFKLREPKKPDKPSVLFNGEEVDINSIPDGSITLDTYLKTDIRANTAGYNALFLKYDNQTLVHVTQTYLDNCMRHDDVVYDGAVKNRIVPEMMRRLLSGNS